MNTNNLSPYHLFCFEYLGFAQLIYNDLLKKKLIKSKKIAIWLNLNPSNVFEFNAIIDETIS